MKTDSGGSGQIKIMAGPEVEGKNNNIAVLKHLSKF